jgi:hypothetical protein
MPSLFSLAYLTAVLLWVPWAFFGFISARCRFTFCTS